MSDALLDEVLAHPHSDDPRRVYADWLSERGDPRGEFIAVQCELARKLDFDAARRENHLLREHRLRWLAELGLSYGVSRPGFVDQLELKVGAVAAAKLARTPLVQLVVSGVTDVKKLSGLPMVPLFGLRDAKSSEKVIRTLCETMVFVGARHLAFHGGQIVDAGGLADLRANHCTSIA